MTESLLLQQQLARATDGPAWHGPSLDELLADVTAEEACIRPVQDAHTIAELVGHIGVWAHVAERRLGGEPTSPGDAEQWPTLETASGNAWNAVVREMLARHSALIRAVAGLDETRLHATLPGRDYSAATMLHGVAEHDAYHGGQIAMLKKIIRAERT